jgi:hypothetical protein
MTSAECKVVIQYILPCSWCATTKRSKSRRAEYACKRTIAETFAEYAFAVIADAVHIVAIICTVANRTVAILADAAYTVANPWIANIAIWFFAVVAVKVEKAIVRAVARFTDAIVGTFAVIAVAGDIAEIS